MSTPNVDITERDKHLGEILDELGPARLAMYASLRQRYADLGHETAKGLTVHLNDGHMFMLEKRDTIHDGLAAGLTFEWMLDTLNRKSIEYLWQVITHIIWDGLSRDDATRLIDADIPEAQGAFTFQFLLAQEVTVDQIIEAGTAIKAAGLTGDQVAYAYQRAFRESPTQPTVPLAEAVRLAAARPATEVKIHNL
jgi:hypothetical protein